MKNFNKNTFVVKLVDLKKNISFPRYYLLVKYLFGAKILDPFL